ncbi:MAG: SDR family NAD(P)-dependent oxidoreductase [Verrucomicrobiota bacterium]
MSQSRVALITGGEGDLARTIAQQLSADGWQVHAPGHAELDVTNRESIKAYVDQHFDRIDLLINNAGITRDGAFLKLEETEWDDVLSTNLKGTFLCSQAVLRLMQKQRDGHIINIGSYSALHPPIGQANYAAAKAGLFGLTKSLAKEVGKRNIRVNCVLPGFLETKMTADLPEEVRQRALGQHALGRFNTCDEAARFVVFLASTENLSGQTYQLDSR